MNFFVHVIALFVSWTAFGMFLITSILMAQGNRARTPGIIGFTLACVLWPLAIYGWLQSRVERKYLRKMLGATGARTWKNHETS
jgi:hypothetical protein